MGTKSIAALAVSACAAAAVGAAALSWRGDEGAGGRDVGSVRARLLRLHPVGSPVEDAMRDMQASGMACHVTRRPVGNITAEAAWCDGDGRLVVRVVSRSLEVTDLEVGLVGSPVVATVATPRPTAGELPTPAEEAAVEAGAKAAWARTVAEVMREAAAGAAARTPR